jgi:hypothetical protein
VYKVSRKEGGNSGNKKGDKENQANYTICSNHNSIRGKYFFLALHESMPKVYILEDL